MNIGEANAVSRIVRHLIETAQCDSLPEDVVLAVVELNGRARRALGAGEVLPTVWMMRREEILSSRRTRKGIQRPTTQRRVADTRAAHARAS